MKKPYAAVVLLCLAGLLLVNSLFTVDQTRHAIILQFGEPVDVKDKPGLHIKMPFIQNVIYLDNRLMEYDVDTTIVYTNDKKNMVVDAYVRWKIKDALLFYKRFKGDTSYSIIEDAKRRLGDVIIGELKSKLGHYQMKDIISESRSAIMGSVTSSSNSKLMAENEPSGLEVVDVRIKRADLPPENQKSVYERMKSERDQQAAKYRSEGQMEAQKIRAEADRNRAEMLSKADRASQEIRGQADAEAAGIYAGAYNLDPEFYAFTRSLESYRAAFTNKSTLVLSAEDLDYLKYFGRPSAARP